MSSAIIKKFVGPEIFCDPKCQVSSEVRGKVICFSNQNSDVEISVGYLEVFLCLFPTGKVELEGSPGH